ncbi:hypothetical protein BN1200_430013 [Klebsiella variicola]|nr:hypothetical protein BN1200_430013 [Klebsiella variicola]CTQ12756.1 hypothetical protein BN1200_400013 [Klebsiella variicola]
MYVYRQRLGHLVDSGADLRADVYAAGLSPGLCADPLSHRRFIGAAAGAGVAVCAAVSRLPTALPTGCPPRHLLLAGAPLPADFSRRLAAVAGGMVSGGTADRPWHLSAAVLTRRCARDGRLSLTRYLHFEFAGRFPGSGEYAEKRAIPSLKQQRHTMNNQTAEDQYDYASQYILHSSTSELLTAPRRRGSTFPSAHSGAEDLRRQLKSSKNPVR